MLRRRRCYQIFSPARVAVATLLLSVASHGCGAIEEHRLPGADEGGDAASRSSTPRIVGGSVFTDLPAVGMIFYGRMPVCTGTLISPRRVLTAAHCFLGKGPPNLSFRIGPSIDQVEHRIEIVETHSHPQFRPRGLTNDIAYAVLERDAPVEPLGVVIHMDRSWVGRSLLFVGYGVNNGVTNAGSGVKRAMTTQLDVLYSTAFFYYDTSRQTCRGDSGGPALFRDRHGAYLVAGVVSAGDRECRDFGISTRVDPYTAFFMPHSEPQPDTDGGSSGSGGDEETPWSSSGNGVVEPQSPADYTLGYRFTVNADGQLTKVGGSFDGTETLYIWDDNGQEVAKGDVTSANSWSFTDIGPVPVAAGSTYTVGVYAGRIELQRRRLAEPLPQAYGNIAIHRSVYAVGFGFPSSLSSAAYLMLAEVDVGFVAGAPSSGADNSCNEDAFGLQSDQDAVRVCVDGTVRTLRLPELLECAGP